MAKKSDFDPFGGKTFLETVYGSEANARKLPDAGNVVRISDRTSIQVGHYG
ncbi:MAG: hypothetical protein U5S82_13220 [Gammaproteobacteria bacterium]|nr:hypothetical protein [Gammaproteobacteria bacterium]